MINIIPCNEIQAEAQRLCDLFEPCYKLKAEDLDALSSLAYSSSLCGSNEGTITNQDNRIKNFITNGSNQDVSVSFNSSPQVTVSEIELLNVINPYLDNTGDNPTLITDYYFLRTGKGTYGSGSGSFVVPNGFTKYRDGYSVELPPTVEGNNVVVVELDYSNTSTPEVIGNQNGPYTITSTDDYYFVITNNGTFTSLDKKVYRFTGADGTYGTGQTPFVNGDFLLIDTLDDETINNTGLEGYTEFGSLANNDLVVQIDNGSSNLTFKEDQIDFKEGEVTIENSLTVMGETILNNLTFNNVDSINAPTYTNAEIDAVGDGSLITKRYFDANSSAGSAPTGLEAIDEGNGIGWRLIGKNPNLHGNIGLNAVDLSIGDSSNDGATGLNSFAVGRDVNASGAESIGMGFDATASGNNAIALGRSSAEGDESVAIGPNSRAAGDETISIGSGFSFGQGSISISSYTSGRAASVNGKEAIGITTSNQGLASGEGSIIIGAAMKATAFREVAVGAYGTQKVANSTTAYNALDRAFSVGVGDNVITSGPKGQVDAFTIYKNGAAVLHPISLASVTNAEAGMFIIDSADSNKLKFYDGTAWRTVSFT